MDLTDEQLAEARRQLDETDRWRAEVVAYRKDGTPVWVELTNTATKEEHGRVSGCVGIHRDIIERRKAEEELREASRRIEDIL
jgi:PAS domain S-box-containing protein